MRNLAKLFVLAMCLIVVGSAFAGKVKGPDARLVGKHGTTMMVNESADSNFELPAVGTRRPGHLDEVIISENFDDLTPGTLPAGWIMVDVDGGTCSDANWPFDMSQWTVLGAPFQAHSGTNTVANVYNDQALPNNDWLILPQQTLGGEITLTFWAASQQQEYLETFAVKVSTTGAEPANFTTTLATFTNHSITWTEHTFDLSAYAGTPFYVGFHHTSIDKWVLKIDDVLLEAGEAGPQGSIVGTVTDFETGLPISGADVEIDGGASTTTDASGQYAFPLVNIGTYNMTFSKANYEDELVVGVEVTQDNVTTVDAALIASSQVTTDYPSNNTPVAIPDEGTAAKTLVINDDVLIEDVDITVNITHTYVSDLDLYLVAPWADSVQLVEDPTDFPAGANMTNCRFDDEADTPFEYSAGGAPYTGSWQPFAPLSAFDGFTSMGTWALRAVDNEAADVGSINNFTIHITHEASAADDAPGSVPSEFTVSAAYPNPFNPSTQISFNVPNTTNATLKIFNSLGQEVATLIDGQVVAGTHTAYFTAYNLPSGLYFAQFNAGSFSSTQKLVLLK